MTFLRQSQPETRENSHLVQSNDARASLELFGWGEVGDALQQLTREQRWKEMPALLTDVILDTFLITADYNQLPKAMVSRFGGLVDRVTLTVPTGPAHDSLCAQTIKELREETRGCDS